MVPEKINRRVKILLEKMGIPIEQSIYITIKPEPYATVNECINSVQRKVNEQGGSQIFGWAIWQTEFITEAEFHSVWKEPHGALIDITPKIIPIDKILFLIDERIIYTGEQIDNIRINTTDNSIVDDHIKITEYIFKFMNKGKRSKEYKVIMSGPEVDVYKYLEMMAKNLSRFYFIGNNQASPCFCESGRPYYSCHGDEIRQVFNKCNELLMN